MPSVNITNHVVITLEINNLKMPAVFVTLCLLVGVVSCLCTICTGIFGLTKCLHRLCCPSGCCTIRVPVAPPADVPEPTPDPCRVAPPSIPDTLHGSFGTLRPLGEDAPMDDAANGIMDVGGGVAAATSASVDGIATDAGASHTGDNDSDVESGVEIIDVGGEATVFYNVSTPAGQALIRGAARTEYEEAREEASRYTRPSVDLFGNPLGKKKRDEN